MVEEYQKAGKQAAAEFRKKTAEAGTAYFNQVVQVLNAGQKEVYEHYFGPAVPEGPTVTDGE